MSEPLRTYREGAATVLTLNRPDCRNALSGDLIGALTAALRGVESDTETRCVIITGAPPAFCAGLDLREVAECSRRAEAFDTSALWALYETIESLSQPVIAAVNGPALAGGAGLVTACDLAVFAESATIGYPGVKQGLAAPVIAPGLLRLVGERHAARLLLTGEAIGARRALEFGLCNEIASHEQLLARARRLAGSIASNPPGAVADTKRMIQRIRGPREGDGGKALRRLCASVPLTDESRRALRP